MPANDPVVMRRSGDPAHETASRHRNTRGRIEIGSAVAPPGARHDNAEPTGRVTVRRTHEARPPAHQCVLQARLVDVPCQRAILDARLGEGRIRLPLQLAWWAYDCLVGVQRARRCAFREADWQSRNEGGEHQIPPKSRLNHDYIGRPCQIGSQEPDGRGEFALSTMPSAFTDGSHLS